MTLDTDASKRRTAALITAWTGYRWLVLWGPYSQQLSAFFLGDAGPGGTMVSARTGRALRRLLTAEDSCLSYHALPSISARAVGRRGSRSG